MKLILKLTSMLVLWGVVVYMVVYVDPETVRDAGIEGVYLPFWGMVVIATWYTMFQIAGWVMATIIATMAGLALILAITGLMSWFLAIVMVLSVSFAFFLQKHSDSLTESEKIEK